jgi:hypothetical protein
MAHEFAHDLDWQAAKREYGGTGWYRTDHALRQAVDQLAGALRLMASATRADSIERADAGYRQTHRTSGAQCRLVRQRFAGARRARGTVT